MWLEEQQRQQKKTKDTWKGDFENKQNRKLPRVPYQKAKTHFLTGHLIFLSELEKNFLKVGERK